MHSYYMCDMPCKTNGSPQFTCKLKILNWFHVHNNIGLSHDKGQVIKVLWDNLNLIYDSFYLSIKPHGCFQDSMEYNFSARKCLFKNQLKEIEKNWTFSKIR